MKKNPIGLLLQNNDLNQAIKTELIKFDESYIAFELDHVDTLIDAISRFQPKILVVDSIFIELGFGSVFSTVPHDCAIVFVIREENIGFANCFALNSMLGENEIAMEFLHVLKDSLNGYIVMGRALKEVAHKFRVSSCSPRQKGLVQIDMDLLELLIQRLTTKQIAEQLGMSVSAANKRLFSICKKCNVKTPRELIQFIRISGWCNLFSGQLILF